MEAEITERKELSMQNLALGEEEGEEEGANWEEELQRVTRPSLGALFQRLEGCGLESSVSQFESLLREEGLSGGKKEREREWLAAVGRVMHSARTFLEVMREVRRSRVKEGSEEEGRELCESDRGELVERISA